MDQNGQKRILIQEERENFERISRKMGERGLRPILIAYTQVEIEQQQQQNLNNFVKKRRILKGSASLPRLAA